MRRFLTDAPSVNRIAETYVHLVLALGQHDADYVDAYYGPPEWQHEEAAAKKSLTAIKSLATGLLAELQRFDTAGAEEIVRLRQRYLGRQLQSLIARTEILDGRRYSFDEEARALYDADPPHYSAEHFDAILNQVESLLTGRGTLIQRYDEYRKKFVIPPDKLDAVFSAAIAECRSRTIRHIVVPAAESFKVEYVTNKPWSGYNWYKGNGYSVIQVNSDLPITIDRAVDLAAHEGYPGHHVYNALLEQHLVRERKWMEFTAYPLFSPQSLIAEGTANFGIEVAFPGKERLTFERETLFPLAGIDPDLAEPYYRVFDLVTRLGYAGNEAARGYLDGRMSKENAVEWLMNYALMPKERAEQRIRFFDKYRSYVINYNVGLDLVRQYIERRGGTPENASKRWDEFGLLISSPRLPSGLQ